MSRYFIELAFKGTNYHGWQAQPNAVTVQDEIEHALTVLFHEDVKLTGAGRTDTGVHAKFYTAHFDSENTLAEHHKDLVYKLNAILSRDISISHVYKVLPEAHARFSAVSRTYQYKISRFKDPFTTDFAWYYSLPLDLDAMNECAAVLKDYVDFTSFSKLHTDTKTNDCNIYRTIWTAENGQLIFEITANRFLRNMVRSIVGTMVDVGRHKIGLDGFRKIIEAKDRNAAGFSAPAHGLILLDIQYADNIKL